MATSYQTKWTLYFLCQKDTNEKLRFIKNILNHLKNSIEELEVYIKTFHDLGALPIPINPNRLDDGDGIVQTLTDNNACYHLSCKLLLNNQKLERAKDKCNKKNVN